MAVFVKLLLKLKTNFNVEICYFVPSNKICSSFLKSKVQCQGRYKYNQLFIYPKATMFEKRTIIIDVFMLKISPMFYVGRFLH